MSSAAGCSAPPTVLVQAAVLAVVFAVLYWLAGNVVDNLEQRNIRSGFEFLKNASNIEIGETSIAFTSSDSVARAFFVGLLNTLKVSFFAVISATVLGIIVGLMRLAAHPCGFWERRTSSFTATSRSLFSSLRFTFSSPNFFR